MDHLEKGVQSDIQEVPRNDDVTDDSDWVSAFLVL